LTHALEVDPGQDLARFALAQVWDNLGKSEVAAAEFNRVVQSLRGKLSKNPNDIDARLNLARVLDRTGRRAEADAEYDRLRGRAGLSPAVRAALERRRGPSRQ
jgi:Tfp pilus assembly protein PilF